MASGKKKGRKNSKGKKKTAKGAASSLKDTTAGFLDEVGEHGNALAGDVRQLFDTLTDKVTGLANTAAETSVAVAEKAIVKEPVDLLRGLLEDVREAGEASIKTIAERFEAMRSHAEKSVSAVGEKKVADKTVADKTIADKTAVDKTAVDKTVADKDGSRQDGSREEGSQEEGSQEER